MKVILLVFSLLNLGMAISRGDESIDKKADRLAYWRKELSALGPLEKLTNEERFEGIGKILRGVGFPNAYGNHEEEATKFQIELQHEILSTSGHALYFGDKIKNTKAGLSRPPDWTDPRQLEYDRERYRYFRETLVHMPTPEAIQVLGEFLWDNDDTYQQKPGQDWFPPEPNSFLVARTLRQIGLRDSPPHIEKMEDDADIDLWRAWYEDVKNGKRSFSFEGQSVEYRFKPGDGFATTTISIEEQSTPALPKSDSVQQAPRSNAGTPARWPWIVATLIAAGLIAAGALRHKRRKSVE